MLMLVTVAVYGPATSFQFLNTDDGLLFSENPHVRAGLTAESFKWAWTSVVTGNWHPITMLSFLLDCQLFGVKPWWPHLVNVLLHAANTVLLFGLLQRMTRATWRSAMVAALFALHPLHVESVAWMAERKDVLSTFFWFLTTWAYLRYTQNHFKYYALSLLFFALGLMSKPMLVTLPFTLLLLDYWPLERMKQGWRLLWEKVPFLAMSAVMCVVTFLAQKESGAMPLSGSLSVGNRIGNALISYMRYAEKMFWPRHLTGLCLLGVDAGQWRWWEALLAALLLVAASALVLWQWRRRPYLAMGWFWYLGTLVPVIGLVQVGGQAMADRYTYVPLIGLFVMVVWGGWETAERLQWAKAVPVAAAGSLAACAALTVHQEFFWKNEKAYNERLVEVSPHNYIGLRDLGICWLEEKRTNEAISNFQYAIQLNPTYAGAHQSLGIVLQRLGNTGEAIRQFQEAIRFRAHYAEAYDGLGTAFDTMGRFDEAVRQYREAIRSNPDDARIHYNLAGSLHREGQIDEALKELQQAIRLQPDCAEAYNNVGAILEEKGQPDQAIRQYQEAVRLQPESAQFHFNLGVVLNATGHLDEGISEFEKAIQLRPDFTQARNNLGIGLGRKGRLEEAVSQFREAIRLKPNEPESHINLSYTLSVQGKREEAAEQYRQALRLNPNLPQAQNGLRPPQDSK
jgi:tetratricopeptide (TPR) repeat protein